MEKPVSKVFNPDIKKWLIKLLANIVQIISSRSLFWNMNLTRFGPTKVHLFRLKTLEFSVTT